MYCDGLGVGKYGVSRIKQVKGMGICLLENRKEILQMCHLSGGLKVK